MVRYRQGWAGVLMLAATWGCNGAATEPSGTLGDLGEGVFHYGCVEEGDPVCNESEAVDSARLSGDLGLPGETPSAIAVGARFNLTYFGDTASDDHDTLLVETVPARPSAVSTVGGFSILAPGLQAFLARSPKKIVADFIHLEAFEARELDVWYAEQRIEALTMNVGDEVAVAVVPQDGTGISLAGALSYQWSVSGTAITIDAFGSSETPSATVELNEDEVRVYAAAEGEATLTVGHDDLVKEVHVTVQPEVSP